VLMSPFMSCGARLAVYALFAAAFFPVGGQNIVFALYVIGVLFVYYTVLIANTISMIGLFDLSTIMF
jgi:ferrous iron transport protein B